MKRKTQILTRTILSRSAAVAVKSGLASSAVAFFEEGVALIQGRQSASQAASNVAAAGARGAGTAAAAALAESAVATLIGGAFAPAAAAIGAGLAFEALIDHVRSRR